MSSDEWEHFRNSLTQRLKQEPEGHLLEELDGFIANNEIAKNKKHEAAALRGEILESMGCIAAAELCYREALELSPRGAYAEYVLQLTLGDLKQDASFYLDAVQTALIHERMECISALDRLTELIPAEELDVVSRDIIARGIKVSWSALYLDGLPPTPFDQALRKLHIQLCTTDIQSAIQHGSISCAHSLNELLEYVPERNIDPALLQLIHQGI